MIKNFSSLIHNCSEDEKRHYREFLLVSIDEILFELSHRNYFEDYQDLELEKPLVIAVGKGAYGMFDKFSRVYEYAYGIISSYPIPSKFKNVELYSGGHPFPNGESIMAARRAVELLENFDYKSLVFLVSGGGSSMFELPRVPLEDLVKTTELLLSSGANIDEINTVRKHLSYVKGGQILKWLKSKAYAFLMSDVIGDRVDLIASGLTTCDSSTFMDALTVLQRYGLISKVPETVRDVIIRGCEGLEEETLKDCEYAQKMVKNFVILKNSNFLEKLKESANKMGIKVMDLGSDNHQDVEELVSVFVDISRRHYLKNGKPLMVLAGGEVKVKVSNPSGKGGRNQELALRVALAMSKIETKFIFVAIGTDGIDGSSDAAGAIVDDTTLRRGKEAGLDALEFLKGNNSNEFFRMLGEAIFTGPTGINLKDVYCLLLY